MNIEKVVEQIDQRLQKRQEKIFRHKEKQPELHDERFCEVCRRMNVEIKTLKWVRQMLMKVEGGERDGSHSAERQPDSAPSGVGQVVVTIRESAPAKNMRGGGPKKYYLITKKGVIKEIPEEGFDRSYLSGSKGKFLVELRSDGLRLFKWDDVISLNREQAKMLSRLLRGVG